MFKPMPFLFVLFSYLGYSSVNSIDTSIKRNSSVFKEFAWHSNKGIASSDLTEVSSRVSSNANIALPLLVNATINEAEEADLRKNGDEIPEEKSKRQESESKYSVSNVNNTFINGAFRKYYNFYSHLDNNKNEDAFSSDIFHVTPNSNYEMTYRINKSNATIINLDNEEITSHSEKDANYYNQEISIANEMLSRGFNDSDRYNDNMFEDGENDLFTLNYNDTSENYGGEFASDLFDDVSNRERGYYNYHDKIKRFDSYVFMFVNDFISHLSVQNECRNHSLFYLKHVSNYTTWALKMLDSTAKIPDGILHGNIRHLGNFDECLTVRATEDVSGKKNQEEVFRGKYCLASLQFSVKEGIHQHELENLLNIMTSGRKSLEITRNRKGNFLPYFALFEWAMCVPSTCTAADLETNLNRIFNAVLNIWDLEVNVMVAEESCHVENKFTLDSRDFAMIAIILTLLLTVGATSAYDVLYKGGKNNEGKKGLLENTIAAFSIPRNLKKLLNVNVTSGTIKCLDGIRFLTMLWVIFTHKVFSMSREPWINKVFLLETAESFWKMPLQNSMLNVDTFFVIGGMLRAYNAMNELDRRNFHYLSGFLQRYLRLTPAYGIIIGFHATLLPYLGNGPTWRTNIEVNSERCRKNWILNILYINNYIDSHNMCMPHSWYLAADMQLFLLSPFIVYPLWKWKNLGKLLLGLVSLISIAVLFIVILVNRYLGIQSAGFHDRMLQEYTTRVYLPTHMRTASYIVGLGLGSMLHKLNEDKEFKLPKIWVLIGWPTCLVTLFGVVFGPYKMMLPGSSYQLWEQSLYGALHRFSWALAVAWIIFACHKGYGDEYKVDIRGDRRLAGEHEWRLNASQVDGVAVVISSDEFDQWHIVIQRRGESLQGLINTALSITLVKPLSRLTYCAYLVHFIIIMVGTSKLRTALYMDDYFIVHQFIADTAISLFVAAILFLCVEQPFLNVTKMIFQRRK